jgi:Flp pilus assembly protein TadD
VLRDGAVSRARVPLLQAIELDPHDPKLAANVALYFVAGGDAASAQALIAQQALPPDTRTAIERDALNVAHAQHGREIDAMHAVVASAALPAPAGTVARADWLDGDVPPRLLERIAR